MKNDTTNSERVSPVNKFWVWIVVALASTVTSVAMWGNSNNEKIIKNCQAERKKVELERDSFKNESKAWHDSVYVWKDKYNELEASSLDRLLEYDDKLRKFNALINRQNSDLIKSNTQKQVKINKLIKKQKN